MRLTWIPNASVSALHAAEALFLYRLNLSDPRVTEAIGPYANALGNWVQSQSVYEAFRTWQVLIGQASMIESNWDLSRAVVRKVELRGSEESNIAQLAGLVTDIEAAYSQLYPKFNEQIPLRSKPLQDHWLGYGAGLLAHLGRMTQKGMLVDEAKVMLMQPALGGAGVAHIEQNTVRIEAVLTNPMNELPEVVRLGWLLSQLHLDQAVFSESLGSHVLAKLAPLAMLPPILAAAEVLELSKCDEAVAELAIEHWHIPVPRDQDIHMEIVPSMMDWWETYLQTRPDWHVAMQAFAKMLGIQ